MGLFWGIRLAILSGIKITLEMILLIVNLRGHPLNQLLEFLNGDGMECFKKIWVEKR